LVEVKPKLLAKWGAHLCFDLLWRAVDTPRESNRCFHMSGNDDPATIAGSHFPPFLHTFRLVFAKTSGGPLPARWKPRADGCPRVTDPIESD
jgi:hypothetical protein